MPCVGFSGTTQNGQKEEC